MRHNRDVHAAQGPLERMKDNNVSTLTESLPLKVSAEMQADLRLIATAKGTTMADIAREFIAAGCSQIRHEYTVAHRLMHGEQIAGETRGKSK